MSPATAKPSWTLIPDSGVMLFLPGWWPSKMGRGTCLAIDPGVREGERHRKLCEMLGRELGLGRSPAEVEAEALAWADRCSPPVSHADVARQLRSLGKRHEARQPHPPVIGQTAPTVAPASGDGGCAHRSSLQSPLTPVSEEVR